MPKLPWFPFYPSDFLRDERVQLMTNEQVGMYVKLLCHQWIEGSIPAKASRDLAVLRLGYGDASEMPDFDYVVAACFRKHPREKGRLINKRLEEVRIQQEEVSLKKQEAGRAGGQAKARLAVLDTCQISATSKPLAKPSYSESESKSESKTERKKKREEEKKAAAPLTMARLEAFAITPDLEDWGKGKGVTDLPSYLDEFKDYWRSMGGKRKGGQYIVDWPATFRIWITYLKTHNKLHAQNWQEEFLREQA